MLHERGIVTSTETQILIAEDDLVSRKALVANLQKWGYSVTVAEDGAKAIEAFKGDPNIHLAILDWMMPELEGVEVCRQIKEEVERPFTYVIMLTALNQKQDLVRAFEAGADDYVSKPWDASELHSRIKAGLKIIGLEATLKNKIDELQQALAQVKQLEGILPICAWCHKIRDDSDYWGSVEEYLETHSNAKFSHSICPTCLAKKYGTDEDEEGEEDGDRDDETTHSKTERIETVES